MAKEIAVQKFGRRVAIIRPSDWGDGSLNIHYFGVFLGPTEFNCSNAGLSNFTHDLLTTTVKPLALCVEHETSDITVTLKSTGAETPPAGFIYGVARNVDNIFEVTIDSS